MRYAEFIREIDSINVTEKILKTMMKEIKNNINCENYEESLDKICAYEKMLKDLETLKDEYYVYNNSKVHWFPIETEKHKKEEYDECSYILSNKSKPCYLCGRETNKLNYIFECYLCSYECEKILSEKYMEDKGE